MQDRFADDERVDRLVDAGPGAEQELARLQGSALPVEEGLELEQEGLVDDPFALEQGRDLAGADALRDENDLVGGKRAWLVRLLLDEDDADDERHRADDDEGQEPREGREQAAPLLADARRRRRCQHRLQRIARAARRQPLRRPGGALERHRRFLLSSAEEHHPARSVCAARVAQQPRLTLRSIVAKRCFRRRRPKAPAHAARRKTSEALVPPKPKEFDSTMSMSRFFAACGTRSIAVSTDGLSRLIVGGATPSRMARIEKIASIAPAAPRRCPVADFVDDIASLPAALPTRRSTALSSISSPSGVEVPWALM